MNEQIDANTNRKISIRLGVAGGLLAVPILPQLFMVVALVLVFKYPELCLPYASEIGHPQVGGWAALFVLFESIIAGAQVMIVYSILCTACLPTTIIAFVLSFRAGKATKWPAKTVVVFVISCIELVALILPTITTVVTLFAGLKYLLSLLCA